MTAIAQVPDGTLEITYTGADGSQQSIPLKRTRGGTLALPRDAADAAILEGFGWPAVTTPAPAEEETAPTQADEATTPATAEEG